MSWGDEGSSEERRRLASFYFSERFLRRHEASDPGNRYLASTRWRVIIEAIRRLREGCGRRRYLELGCGNGDGLVKVLEAGLGLDPIIGVDLLQDRWGRGVEIGERAQLVCADAGTLPFRDGQFDVVVQVMMISSILSARLRRRVGGEILRIMSPEGLFISLDLRYPQIPAGGRIALGVRELRETFDGHEFEMSTHGLLPPLARLLASRSHSLCDLLARIPILRPYRLGVLRASSR